MGEAPNLFDITPHDETLVSPYIVGNKSMKLTDKAFYRWPRLLVTLAYAVIDRIRRGTPDVHHKVMPS